MLDSQSCRLSAYALYGRFGSYSIDYRSSFPVKDANKSPSIDPSRRTILSLLKVISQIQEPFTLSTHLQLRASS